MIRTAFFGGSFDPPHLGHLGVARAAVASGRTDRVLFVPAWRPPHKPAGSRAGFEERFAMLRLLLEGAGNAFEVSDLEERLRLDPSYTIDVLEHLKRELPGPLQLLIGADSLAELHNWHDAARLAKEYEILSYPRPGVQPDREALERHWPPETARKLLSGLLPGEFFELSSTNIRNAIAFRDETGHINIGVPASVGDYIRRHRLYEETREL